MHRFALDNYMVSRGGSVNPKKFLDETFELFSIPAYDQYVPEIVKGNEIGSSKKIVQENDVLLSRIVPHIRRVWVVGPSDTKRQIASSEWIIFRGEDFLPNYMRHFLLSDVFHHQFMQTVAGVGGSLLRARPQGVAEIKIPLPSLDEQERIATILDKADAIRRKRQEAIELSDEVIQSAYSHMCGSLNPDYHEWEPYLIEELAQPKKNSMRTGPFGSALKHSEFVNKGIAVLGIDNAVSNYFSWKERRFITPEKYKSLQRYTVFPGDVIITIMGTTGRSAVVPRDIPKAISTKHLATITPNTELVYAEYLSNAIHRDSYVLRQVAQKNKGAIMPGLNLKIIREIEVRLPPLHVQRQFVRFLEKTRCIQSKCTIDNPEEQLFSSLQQRAFRGDL